MSIVSLISFIVLFILFMTGLRKESDFFSPGRIFGMIWSLAIGLADFKFSRLQVEWTLFDWVVLLIGVFYLILGVYASFVLNFSKVILKVESIRKSIRQININEPLLFKIIISFFLVFALAFLAEYFIEGYIPLFTAQPDKARKMFGVFGLHLLVNGVNIILFLIAEYFILVRSNKLKKFFLTIIFLISTASFFLLLQRYNFFILAVMVVCFMYYSGRRFGFRTILTAIVVIVGLVVLIRTVRIAQFAEFYFYATSQMKFPVKYAIFSEPYMYIVMNLENFAENFPKLDTHTIGMHTTDFMLAITGVKHYLAEYFNIEKFPHYIGGYNTFPFYWVYYYDFGFLGLAFFPFIIGFIISEFYYRLRSIPSLLNLTLYSIGFVVIVISYSSDPLTRLDMVFNFVIIIIVQKYIVKNSENKLE